MSLSQIELDTVSVLRYALNFGNAQAPEIESEWKDILSELSFQTVAGLVADCSSLFATSDSERLDFLKMIGKNLTFFHQIMNCQDRIIQALDGLDFVVLKGAAAAMYYPRPEYRQMGDIDILVCPVDFERAEVKLMNFGFNKRDVSKRHTVFESDSKIHIELHRCFYTSDNEIQNAVSDQILFNAISKWQFADVCNHKVPTLPTLENGLVLLGHINQHLSSGLGLRQIIDWMMYVKEKLDDTFWNESFCAAAESIEMRQLAEIVTLMCKRYFGLEGIFWCDETEESLADELLEYIFSKGNFGCKNYSSNKTLTVMHQFRNPIAAFRYLNAGGLIHWKAAQKHRFLRCFAWIYQIGHIIKMGLKRKATPNVFVEEAKQSKREMDLLKRINVTKK